MCIYIYIFSLNHPVTLLFPIDNSDQYVHTLQSRDSTRETYLYKTRIYTNRPRDICCRILKTKAPMDRRVASEPQYSHSMQFLISTAVATEAILHTLIEKLLPGLALAQQSSALHRNPDPRAGQRSSLSSCSLKKAAGVRTWTLTGWRHGGGRTAAGQDRVCWGSHAHPCTRSLA